MSVSPGTGAGIGIAIGLLLLIIAGPLAYTRNKRRRALVQIQHPTEDTLEVGQKPQLEDTAVSPNIWRNSNYASSTVSGPEMVSLNDSAGLGIQRRPVSEAAGSEVGEVDGVEIPAEVDATDERARAELDVHTQSPYGGRRAELRADMLTPPDSLGPQQQSAFDARPVAEGHTGRMTSDTSLPGMPVLPGPLLPPKAR